MALHLLVTTNLNRRIVHDVDFGTLLKLSQDQTIILDENAARFFGCRIPDRKLIVVAQETTGIFADHIVDTVEQALDRCRAFETNDAIALGFTRKFNKRILSHVGVLHHHTIECSRDRNYQLFPVLSERQWEPLFMENVPKKPLGRKVAVVKRSFKRRK